MAETDSWPRQLTTIVGAQVKHYRENYRGGRLSARRLADLTEERGHRVEYQVIANMESGRRANVTLAELLVLASALNVTPVQLVVPVNGQADFPVAPEQHVEPWQFFKWFGGARLGTLPGPESPDYVLAVDAYRRHDAAVSRYLLARGSGEADAYLDALVNVRAEIRNRGWRLPSLSDRAGRVVAEMGVTSHPPLDVAVARREQELAQ